MSIWLDIYPDSWEITVRVLLFRQAWPLIKHLQLTLVIGPMDGEENKYSKHKASAPNEKTESHVFINFYAACQRFKVLMFGSHSLKGEQNYSRSGRSV